MPDGVMSWHFRKQRLAGYSCPTVVLHFFFPRGTVDGEEFEGRSQHAYLPDDEEGRSLLALFQLAFRRRLLFGLRPSLTTGRLRPTFSIHMKTSMSGGPARHGYPDPQYYRSALEELRLAGIEIDAALPVAVSLHRSSYGCARCGRVAVAVLNGFIYPVTPLACFFALAATGEGRMAVLAAISVEAGLTLPAFPSTLGFLLWILLTTIAYTSLDLVCMLATGIANVYVVLRLLLQHRYSCFDTVANRARPWVANRLFQLGLLNLVILYSGIWQYTFGKVALAGAAASFLVQLLRRGHRAPQWVQDTTTPDLHAALEMAPWPGCQEPVGEVGPFREEDWPRYSCCTSLQGRTDMRRVHQDVMRSLEENSRANVSSVIQTMLANELRFSEEHAVFYHSYSSSCILYELQAVLAAFFLGYPQDGPPILRLTRAPFENVSSLQQLLDLRRAGTSDRTPEFRALAISVFCSCFASGGYGRSMLENYLVSGYHTPHDTSADIRRLLELVLQPAGELEELPALLSGILALGQAFDLDSRASGAKGAAKRRGHVLQIFLHHSVVDAVVYGAQPLGSLAPQGVPFSEWLRQQCPVEGQARLLMHPDLFLDTRRGLVHIVALSPRPFDRLGLRSRLRELLGPHLAKAAQEDLKASLGFRDREETPSATQVSPEVV
ncbi:Dtx3l [Symbiodinium sp. CCMP2456]|nr:Dtx3l [Symbiodinium sp. CCMP2456]